MYSMLFMMLIYKLVMSIAINVCFVYTTFAGGIMLILVIFSSAFFLLKSLNYENGSTLQITCTIRWFYDVSCVFVYTFVFHYTSCQRYCSIVSSSNAVVV